ncbi:hypothetical protein CYLTODRAFT_487172 [Cylindrobasidium torrendii FP15055 ss-10]|uniref:Small ribosomal subunit protein mS33 n=1 Tax=Cylindrobasidium torrendii FP15055 ss-10 TaxID=1314674 RepID=A0A0D7BLY3_9AGAR|nr:hypothetical protein CYLTODRAFT_487172 [Cylindrobasidium torrendii FP15055 ss-10]
MSFIAPARMQLLKRMQCSIFETSYNPENLRTGAKYLRKRLRGPSMMQYYPPQLNIPRLARQFPELQIDYLPESVRVEDVKNLKARGKGRPKKRKTKAEGKSMDKDKGKKKK